MTTRAAKEPVNAGIEGAPRSFEEDLARLEEIVAALESGDLSLEDSLKLFEEGVRLSGQCHKRLDEAEGKLQVLRPGGAEKIVVEDFSPEEGK